MDGIATMAATNQTATTVSTALFLDVRGLNGLTTAKYLF